MRNSSAVSYNRCDRGLIVREALVLFEVRGVKVLGAMGQETDSGHEQHDVDTAQPMVLEHLSNFMDEYSRLRLGRPPDFGFLSLSAEEKFAFRKESSYYCGESGNTGTGPE